MKLLTDDFLSKFPETPPNMNELGSFVFYRTYSRFDEEKGRRETWKETVARSVEYNVSLAIDHLEKQGVKITDSSIASFKKEAEILFANQFGLKQFLSGRTLWVGGAPSGVATKYPLANFNCAFVNIQSYDDIGDLFYMLLVGTGVGLRTSKEYISKLPPLRRDIKIEHRDFIQRYPIVKQPDTSHYILSNKQRIMIDVGDSKEGWVKALRLYLDVLSTSKPEYEDITEINFSYDYIRPKGARLKTFGGTASGYEPLKEMFIGIEKVINGQIDDWLEPLAPAICEKRGSGKIFDHSRVQLRPVHIMDIANLIGNNVVVGGVRRTAEIVLFDEDDYEILLSKYGINGIWDEAHHQSVIQSLRTNGLEREAELLSKMELFNPEVRPLHHRRMSNNSVAFVTKPKKDFLDLIFTIMRGEGEPGFINVYEAARRRLEPLGIRDHESILELAKRMGLNPCAEILLETYGVCNLTTLNIMAFVAQDSNGEYYLHKEDLFEAQRLSVRAGMRMALVDLEFEHWDKTQKRDALTGNSITGFQDAVGILGYTDSQQKGLLFSLRHVAAQESKRYAKQVRSKVPLLDTTVKPEGTLSQVAGGVSSGVHFSHAPFFIRRVRINADDPMSKVAKELGWRISAEVGTMGYNNEQDLSRPEVIDVAKTIVVDFPVKSTSKKFKDDVPAIEQLNIYYDFQDAYTAHNTSNTITVKSNEWEDVANNIYGNWDNFVGVSFLSHDGGTYVLAPYQEITEQEYNELSSSMKPFDPQLLMKYEDGNEHELEEAECAGGACPIR